MLLHLVFLVNFWYTVWKVKIKIKKNLCENLRFLSDIRLLYF
jgi:hypothetical protein